MRAGTASPFSPGLAALPSFSNHGPESSLHSGCGCSESLRLSTDVLRLLLLMVVTVALLLLLVALLLFERRRAAALGHWQPRVPLCVCH